MPACLSRRAFKRSSGPPDVARSAVSAQRPLHPVPLCASQVPDSVRRPRRYAPWYGRRRIAACGGVRVYNAQAQAAHRPGRSPASSGRVRRAAMSGVRGAAHLPGHARAGQQITVTVDVPPGTPRPDPDPRRQSADRQRPGRHRPAAPDARARARAAARRSRRRRSADPKRPEQPAPARLPVLEHPDARRLAQRPDPGAAGRQAGRAADHGQGRQGSSQVDGAKKAKDDAAKKAKDAADKAAPGCRRCTSPTGSRRSATRPSRSRCPAPRRSACRTSSSTSSASRRSCCRSTRPPASSTACAGRSWPRSTRSRPTTGATSTSPPPAPWAGCSSCPRPGSVRRRRQPRRPQGPFNPVDAIFAAARYLKAAGADQDVRRAIFAYNHADWYVDSVLMRARLIGGLPADLVGSLTGLTQGHFPVHAKARYADDSCDKAGQKRHVTEGANAAVPVESDDHAQGHQHLRRRRARRSSPCRTARSSKIGTQQAPGQASSCCATSTATRTRTRT